MGGWIDGNGLDRGCWGNVLATYVEVMGPLVEWVEGMRFYGWVGSMFRSERGRCGED